MLGAEVCIERGLLALRSNSMAIQLEFGIVVEMKTNEKPKQKINRLWLDLVSRVYPGKHAFE
ncbi:conserved hypothetical protein [Vibrio coralliirubri]|nr:conserved hypothetical protein [Vibrio coralliirubri]